MGRPHFTLLTYIMELPDKSYLISGDKIMMLRCSVTPVFGLGDAVMSMLKSAPVSIPRIGVNPYGHSIGLISSGINTILHSELDHLMLDTYWVVTSDANFAPVWIKGTGTSRRSMKWLTPPDYNLRLMSVFINNGMPNYSSYLVWNRNSNPKEFFKMNIPNVHPNGVICHGSEWKVPVIEPEFNMIDIHNMDIGFMNNTPWNTDMFQSGSINPVSITPSGDPVYFSGFDAGNVRVSDFNTELLGACL